MRTLNIDKRVSPPRGYNNHICTYQQSSKIYEAKVVRIEEKWFYNKTFSIKQNSQAYNQGNRGLTTLYSISQVKLPS